jgi:predicted nucleic acid-binding protein
VTFIIDASAAYDMLCENRWDNIVTANSELAAPDIITAELLNARWKVNRSGNVAPDVTSILQLLKRIRIAPSIVYGQLAAELSERLDHPVYDCLYVAMAGEERLKLLTSDARLIRKLRSHKLDVIVTT